MALFICASLWLENLAQEVLLLVATERILMEEDSTVEKTESSFGVVWQLRRGSVILDTYCPWNGDPRPSWMPEES